MQEPASVMNPEPLDAEPRPAENRKRTPMKFAYASGSKPLEGFTIKRGIGAGGFGDVYYATSDAGKDVALKRIQRNLDVELRGVSQCLNLKHPNLVTLYDIRYDEEDQAWVVMEFVSGESLHDVVDRNPNGMPLDEVDRWFEGIVSGVAYLHDHGIVHRDLKPGNIFLDQGTVKIGDYGLSKFISCSRRSGQTESVGTFHYMAPEIGLGRYGKEIDIYALGILLYEMLTGRVPFDGESSQEIIMKHLTAQPDLSRVSSTHRAIISRALAKDPANRYESAGELLAAFRGESERLGTGPRAAAPPPPPPPRPPRLGYRSRPYAAPQEPIAALLRSGGERFVGWWRSQNTLTRAILATAMVFMLIMNWWVVGLAFSASIIYACYYLLWSIITSYHSPPAPRPAGTNSVPPAPIMATAVHQSPSSSRAAAPPPVRRTVTVTRQQLMNEMRSRLRNKSILQRTRELSGSMLMAAVVAAVVGVFTTVAATRSVGVEYGQWAPLYTWLTISSTVAAWSVLGFSKLWEGSVGDAAIRRFCLLVAGMFVGCFISGVASLLMLDPVYLISSAGDVRSALGTDIPVLYDVTGRPKTLAYAGYFGGLFLTLRWWLAADPLRAARLSFWSTIVALIAAMVGSFFVLPIPSGFLVVLTAMIAIQLSATWIPSWRREEFKERLVASERRA